MKDFLRLMQWPGTAGFHVLSMGVHWKIETKIMAIHQPMERAARTKEPILILCTGKIRRYISSNESLVKQTQVTYKHSNAISDYLLFVSSCFRTWA